MTKLIRIFTMKKAIFILAIASLTVGYLLITHTHASAGGHDQLCLDNYNQCIKGCDGATSCSNQCKTNYDACMR